MKFIINSKERLNNQPIQAVHTDLKSLILYSDMNSVDDDSQIVQISEVSDVTSSVQKDLTTEKQKNDAESLQLENSFEEIVGLLPKTQIFERVSHPF